MQNKFTISNILLAVSILATLIVNIFPEQHIYYNWWTNSYFLEQWNYFHFILQFFTWTFLHWWILHLIMNSIFIFYFWNIVEQMLWKKKYFSFFIFIVLFNWILLSQFAPHQTTIWISGFALALLTYYTLELWSQKNPEYTGWITAIIINVWIWFAPWISLYWHLFWVIGWAIFYFILKNFFTKQEIWFVENLKSYTKKIPKVMPENFKEN